jgi:glycosyltransferase involved in cell wall biosynthesis
MRILVLSFYYPPDIGPGALRAQSIVEALIKEGPADLKIDVITTMPNRYHSLKVSASKFENNNQVSVYRITLPKHNNGMLDQAKAFILFSFEVRKMILKRSWHTVIATSGRLMTASLATWVAKRTNSKIYLDIRDLFTDTMSNILKGNLLSMLIPLFYRLEKWTFQSADKLNVVSAGFLDHVKKTAPNLSPSTYTNGVDEIFLNNDFSIKQVKPKPLILYVGNIGDGQGLHKIIPDAAKVLENFQFKLIGDGSALKLLTSNYLFKTRNNIKIFKPVIRKNLINEYSKADVLFLHLNDYKSFHKVIPSKIFEYAATGKPILAGVSGYAAEFLTKHVEGVEIFNPCDVKSMKLGLKKLLKGPRAIDRTNFCKEYSRKKIMNKLAKDALSLFHS